MGVTHGDGVYSDNLEMKRKLSYWTEQLSGQDLKSRCARSGAVLGVGAIVSKLLGFVSKVILARVLFPQEIGLMVMLISITEFLETVTEIGVKQSIIQNKNGDKPEYLNAAWLFQSLRGIILYAIAFIIAPYVCEFYFRTKTEILEVYSMAELATMVRVTFLTVLFNGFISPRAHALEKQFKFGRAVIITQGGVVLGAIITIILALVMKNVWSIVIGFTSIGFFRCVMSHVLCPFIPRFAFHKESFQGLSMFARGMIGMPLLTYIAFNLDVLVAGKFIPISLIGLYGMAKSLALVPRDFFSRMVNPVLFPAFAEKQDDRRALCRAVLQITKAIALLLIPITVLAIVCSKVILSIIFGEKFASAAAQFNLLSIYVLILVEGTVLASVFFGIGQPGKHRAFVGLRVLILGLFIYPGIKLFGLNGAAAVVLLASFVAICLQVVVIHRTIGLNILNYAISWLPGLSISVPVLAVTQIVGTLKPDSPMLQLAAGVGVLLCVFIGLAVKVMLKSFGKERIRSTKTASINELVVQDESEGT